MSATPSITIHVVRFPDGTFARGVHVCPAYDLSRARFYPRPGPAKSIVTRWVKDNPGEPVPQILTWTLTPETATILDVTEQTHKRIKQAEIRQVEKERRDVARQLEDLAAQERRLAEERKRLEQHTGFLP